MMPANNRGVGSNVGFPDPCLTPTPVPVPIPYPNIGMNMQATPFSLIVRVTMMSALNTLSKITMTSGMEGGVSHPLLKGMGGYTMGNPIVSIEKMPAINQLCPTTGNNYNNPAGAVLVPSATNVFFTYAGARMPRSSSQDDTSSSSFLSSHDLDLLREAAVSGRMIRDGVGIVEIDVFSFNLPTLVHNEIVDLSAKGLKTLVLDLRDNPGGDLDAFLRLADDFLDPGTVIATIRDGDGDETVHRARQTDPYTVPLVLLVNAGTASAAELFAGCLQNHGRALLIGETTYGKNCTQALAALAASGASCATVAKVLLPSGEDIHDRGVRPDIERSTCDAQLQTALEIADSRAG